MLPVCSNTVAGIGSYVLFPAQATIGYNISNTMLPTAHIDHSRPFEFNGYLDKDSLKSSFQGFSKVSGPWTDRGTPRGTDMLARGKDILARGTDIPARGHCDPQNTVGIYSAQSADQPFSTVLKELNENESKQRMVPTRYQHRSLYSAIPFWGCHHCQYRRLV